MSERATIDAAGAPAAIGPYSQAVRHGDVLYCSGVLPLDPGSGELEQESLAAATRRCLANLESVCEAAGTGLGEALRLTIYTTDLDRFAEINDAYAEFFPAAPPARVTVGVDQLPKGARIEIDALVAIASAR